MQNSPLRLSPVTLNPEYSEKWNVHSTDFVVITRDGILVSNTLYRVGGFAPDLNDSYFMLLKHVEAYYPDNITKIKKDKPHLESQWCIVDQNGVEKVNFKQFTSPYLVKDSCIYTLDSNYYNIETGECYGRSFNKTESRQYLFIQNDYHEDKTKRGVLQISKITGATKLYPN